MNKEVQNYNSYNTTCMITHTINELIIFVYLYWFIKHNGNVYLYKKPWLLVSTAVSYCSRSWPFKFMIVYRLVNFRISWKQSAKNNPTFYLNIQIQMHRRDKYLQQGTIIWSVWLNSWVFVYELSGCGFESSGSHLNYRFCVWFEERFLRNSSN